MRKYKVWVQENSPQGGDARNPSVMLLDMEVTVYDTLYLPKIPLVAALRQMYPSPDIEIGYCEELDASQMKYALTLAVKELESHFNARPNELKIGELVESLKWRLEPDKCQVIE